MDDSDNTNFMLQPCLTGSLENVKQAMHHALLEELRRFWFIHFNF